MTQPNKIIPILSLLVSILVIITSCTGILVPGFYARETLNWQAQSLGQDIFDLFLVTPVLMCAAFFVSRQNKNAMLVWAGTIMYLTYTFLIYCFDVHFNRLFPVYCVTLGLSSYMLLYFFYLQIKDPGVKTIENPLLIKTIGIYFLAIAGLFYFLWLSEIIPAVIKNTIPESLAEVGLPTNAVHVIDLSVFLPGIFIAGILLLKKKPAGYLLAPVFLTFFILMDITIGGLIVILNLRGLATGLSVAVVMGILAMISLILLVWSLKNIKAVF